MGHQGRGPGSLPGLPGRGMGCTQGVPAPDDRRVKRVVEAMIPNCAGYYFVAIPLSLIALVLVVGFVLEFLRRERTKTQEDDWMQFGDHNDDAPG